MKRFAVASARQAGALTALALALFVGGCASRARDATSRDSQVVASPVVSVVPRRSGIDWTTRAKLAWARAAEYRALSVAVMTERVGGEATESVVAAIRALGGKVEVRFDDVGYIRALMPLGGIPRLGDAEGVADFEVVMRTAGIANSNNSGRSTVRSRSIGTTPAAGGAHLRTPSATAGEGLAVITATELANNSAYVPRDEIRADIFASRVPLADGRGVTMGIPEALFDITHEAFQEARTLAGDTVTKIAGLLDASLYKPRFGVRQDSDPRERVVLRESGRAGIRPDTTVMSRDNRVPFAGGDVHLPDRGTWHLAQWSRVAREQSRPDTARYVVAWRDTMGIWVDLNGDHDLRNDSGPVPNINVRVKAGRFPVDSVRGWTVPTSFTVTFGPNGLPHIYHDAWEEHTTMAAGSIAGSRFFGGAVGGIAPGARLLLVQGLELEDLILTVRDPRIDVVTMMAVNSHFPTSGGSFAGRVLDRLVRVYRKPIIISAANSGPAIGTVQNMAAATGILGMGAYVSKRSYALNESWRVAEPDNLALYSGRGPAADGALKPDLVAPTQMVTPGSCEPHPDTRMTFRLPPCYMIGAGTSNSGPFAGGAVTLLMSAARLHGWPSSAYDAPTIAWALTASARRIDNAGVHEQGAGLIQLDSAWALMQLRAFRPEIVSSGPVENAYAPYLLNPGRGPGLFLREGWTAGRRESRSITLRRTTGTEQATRYRLRWRGNDGTFALADSMVTLPLGILVEIPVVIAPREPGIHSAAIEVVDSHRDLVFLRVPTTVIAGLSLTPANGFVARHADSIAWPGTRSTFVNVPIGTAVLRVELSINSGAADVFVKGPLAEAGGAAVTSRDEARIRDAVIRYEDPTPGTWEFTFTPPPGPYEREAVSSQSALAYTLTATALMARAEDSSEGQRGPTVTFTNIGAPISSATVRASIGSRRIFEGIIHESPDGSLLPLDPIVIPVEAGTTSLRVAFAIDGLAEALGRRADLHLYSCTESDQCQEQTPIFIEAGRQEIVIPNPAAGVWKVVIDPVRVREKPIPYTLVVIATHPKWGELRPSDVTDTIARPMSSGERRNVSLRIDNVPSVDAARGGADSGRELVSVIDLLAHEDPARAASPQAGWRMSPPQQGPAILAQQVISLPVRRLNP